MQEKPVSPALSIMDSYIHRKIHKFVMLTEKGTQKTN